MKEIRQLQIKAALLALFTGGCFIPVVWIFGSRMAGSLKRITAQADALRNLAQPDASPVTSRIREIHQLGTTIAVAQRTIWSFARFVPKEIVKGIIDGSISTELGGHRQEVAILFTDVRNFTGLAETADPDNLMRQTSRYFTVLTDAFLAEGGTVDKYIGDAVMVFWNAPHPQPDHVERACRAALSAKAASEILNQQFEAEGLPHFVTRFGIHVGDAVVGNVGSAERMDYTVLGSSVNLAARLEALNKEYSTTILVSDAVRQRVEHCFRFEHIASVIAKGMTTETRVHELVEASFGLPEHLRVFPSPPPPISARCGGISDVAHAGVDHLRLARRLLTWPTPGAKATPKVGASGRLASAREQELHLEAYSPVGTGAGPFGIVEGLERGVDRLPADLEDLAAAAADRNGPALRRSGAPVCGDDRRARQVPAIRQVVVDEGFSNVWLTSVRPFGPAIEKSCRASRPMTQGLGVARPTAAGPTLSLPDPMTEGGRRRQVADGPPPGELARGGRREIKGLVDVAEPEGLGDAARPGTCRGGVFAETGGAGAGADARHVDQRHDPCG